MTRPTPHPVRELATRVSDGMQVRLLWHSHEDRVTVAVDDVKTGQAFTVEVRSGQRPMDVFHHPFAYAA